MKLAALVLAALPAFAAAAERPLVLTAGAVMDLCSTPDRSSDRFMLCAALLRGFSDGYERGANRGIVAAFIDDPVHMAASRGVADAQQRAARVRPAAECMPRDVTGGALVDTFTRYMALRPQRGGESYRLPLADALEARYCPR